MSAVLPSSSDLSALPSPTDAARLEGVAPLSHWGVIRAEGEDAAKFLHGQLTQDFALLGQDEARLAAFCSAKGRMQASFIAFRRGEHELLLLTPRETLAATLKRLSMFVLRAKARLTDASEQFALFGLAGDAAAGRIGAASTPWRTRVDGDATVVALYPALGRPRALWVAPVGTAAPAGAPLAEDLWRWGEVQAGIASIGTAVVDAFVPQMLNYESVGGVNFKKGCYPGQEVVARSQFRGTLKRRAFVAHAEGVLSAGEEVFAAGSGDDQPVGTVVQAAAAPGGGSDAIVSLQLAAVAAGGLRAGAVGGAALALAPLPYPLLEDI